MATWCWRPCAAGTTWKGQSAGQERHQVNGIPLVLMMLGNLMRKENDRHIDEERRSFEKNSKYAPAYVAQVCFWKRWERKEEAVATSQCAASRKLRAGTQ
jgi:hypothetical protein